MKRKFTNVKIYFYLLFIVCFGITVLGDKSYDAQGTTIFMIFGFPVFAILSHLSFCKFSDEIESGNPALFKKYVSSFGIVKRLNMLEIRDNPSFERELNESQLDRLNYTKKLTKIIFASFFFNFIRSDCYTFQKMS